MQPASAATPPGADALAALARDALLDLLERGDAPHALRRLLPELTQATGWPMTLDAGREAAAAHAHAHAGAGVPLALERLGRRVGTLQVDTTEPAQAVARRLQPVLATLAELAHVCAQAGAARPRQPGDGPPDHGPSGELIRAALAGAGTFVWQWWVDNDWLSDIDVGFAMLGYGQREGHTQADWDALIHPDDRDANHEAYLRHERGEAEVYEHSYRVRAADRQWRWMLERGRIVERHPDGRPRRMVGTQTDITQRRALEAAAQATEAAEAASRAKTQFLARMSHELRTPLNAVLGFAQLMAMDPSDPPSAQQAERLRHIRGAGEHLLAMITDLLDLTRIESGGMTLHAEAVDLPTLAEQALALVCPAADAAQVALRLEGAPDGAALAVRADRTRLRQVLLNLLSNAVKYNRPGGWVALRLAAEPGGRVRVQVADNGVGIAAEDLPQVFEPFHRGRQAQGAVDGAGIGLAVTRALVQLMGGELSAASTPGLGSSFVVRLPAG